MRCRTSLAVAVLLFVQLIAAVNIIYDETGWTKQDWHKYKLEYSLNYEPSPIDEVIKAPAIHKALGKCIINSLDGPLQRITVPKPVGLWSSEDGTLVETPDEESLEAAVEAVTCTVCHGLVSHVWSQVVSAIHGSEPINEDAVGDMIDEACEQAQAPLKVLQSYRIVKVDAPEAGVTMFVVRSRHVAGKAPAAAGKSAAGATTAHPGTEAEAAATVQSCKNLVNHHKDLLLKPIWKSAMDYFVNHRNLARRMQSKLQLDAADVDEYEEVPEDEEDSKLQRKALHHIPEHKLLPYDKVCLDMEILCPLWASMGECKANPKYMVGTERKIGHCRASCGVCAPDHSWRDHSISKKELSASSSSMLNSLRQTTCTTSQACISGGSGSTTSNSKGTVVQNANILPGAALAKMEGFVLGKPFWGIPGIEKVPTPKPASQKVAADKVVDPAEALLDAADLANKFISIPGMDGFFMYQIHYKTHVYQYHKEFKHGPQAKITEEHMLGLYDPSATEAAYKKDEIAATTDAGKAWQRQQAELLKQQQQQQQQQAASAQTSASSEKAAADSKASTDAAVKAAHTAAVAAVRESDDNQQHKQQLQDSKKLAAADDEASTSKAAAAASTGPAHPPPMLELMDYLPDTASMIHSWFPYFRQMYTGGEKCAGEGGGKPRQVELRVACSPHANSWRLLVREPQFCNYIVVLYHPGLCELPRYKPVPKTALGNKPKEADASSSSSAKDSSSRSEKDSSSSKESEEKGKVPDKAAVS